MVPYKPVDMMNILFKSICIFVAVEENSVIFPIFSLFNLIVI
jgi:hypothetical protein